MENALINEKRTAEIALDIALQVLTENSKYYSILKKILINHNSRFFYFIGSDGYLYHIEIILPITRKK